MSEPSTPFERGWLAGQWTDELIEYGGFASAQACLAYQEKVFQNAIADLCRFPPEYAALHAEYLVGVIIGARESLRGRK